MSPPPDLNDGAGRDESRDILPESCITDVITPFVASHADGLRPSDMIRGLLESMPPWRREATIGDAVYYRVGALEPELSMEITCILLARLSKDELLRILDNGPVFRVRVEGAMAEYKTDLRRHRDEMALVEEGSFATPNTRDVPQSSQDASNQCPNQTQTQYQSQPMVRSQTHLNPRDNPSSFAHDEA